MPCFSYGRISKNACLVEAVRIIDDNAALLIKHTKYMDKVYILQNGNYWIEKSLHTGLYLFSVVDGGRHHGWTTERFSRRSK